METIGEAVSKNASLEKENLLKGFERQLKKRFLKQQPWRTQHKIMKTTSSRQPPRKPARGELVQTRDVDDAVSTSSGTTAFPHTPTLFWKLICIHLSLWAKWKIVPNTSTATQCVQAAVVCLEQVPKQWATNQKRLKAC